ncbi:hypothetical protein [Comamonas testosteroni]|uniref:hypothetical protein n=1 Tax=Comamonas testosteroni TaxID=285 RepID=UPI0009B7F5CF|nr:hypothetical protein [Comamonas testosteroni]
MKKVLIIDTSLLCCWLKVPGKETAGSDDDKWNYDRVNALIEEEKRGGAFLVLPLASLIETGNHIAQSSGNKYRCAKNFAKIIGQSANASDPWIAFSDQIDLWSPENLQYLADSWPDLAVQSISIGDATIKNVADFYAKAGFHVVILTGDAGLKAYEPVKPALVPRRRK